MIIERGRSLARANSRESPATFSPALIDLAGVKATGRIASYESG